MDDAIVVIVTPPSVRTGTAGGFRLLGGGAGADLLCRGVGELGSDDADTGELGLISSVLGPVGEHGELATTRISGGSCVKGASSRMLGRRSNSGDDEGSSTVMDPARPRRRGALGTAASAAATRGRLVELSLLPSRIVSTPRFSRFKFSAL